MGVHSSGVVKLQYHYDNQTLKFAGFKCKGRRDAFALLKALVS